MKLSKQYYLKAADGGVLLEVVEVANYLITLLKLCILSSAVYSNENESLSLKEVDTYVESLEDQSNNMEEIIIQEEKEESAE